MWTLFGLTQGTKVMELTNERQEIYNERFTITF